MIDTIRERNEGEQAVYDLIAASFKLGGQRNSDRIGVLEAVIEEQAAVIRTLAQQSRLAQSVINEHTKGLREKIG